MEKTIPGYWLCTLHGPISGPGCPKCRDDVKRAAREMVDRVEARRKQEKPMTQPTPEQLRDPQWWDENAPEGATHYSEAGAAFMQVAGNTVWQWVGDGWMPKALTYRPKSHPADTKPADDGGEGAVEWTDGLPPAGSTQDDCRIHGLEAGERFEVIAHKGGRAVVYFNNHPPGVTLCKPDEFRPIRSQAERERDELEKEAVDVANRAVGHEANLIPVSNMVSALYDAGLLRKGGE